MKKTNWKKVSIGLLAIFVVLQFFRIDKTNPPVDSKNDFLTISQAPNDIAQMMKAACYDCHSHETKYPWYTNISPVSWWIKGHVDHGKEHLNFSEWGSYSADKAHHKLEECYEEVEGKKMPLTPYIFLHSEAWLTDEQRSQLVEFFKEKAN